MASQKPGNNDLVRKVAELERCVEKHCHVERELRLAKEFSDNLIETAHAIVVTLDLDAKITRFNQAAERLTGYTKDEVIGQDWIDVFIPSAIRDEVRRVFADVVQSGGEISSHENPIVSKDGVERIINWSNNIIRGDNGSPIGVLSVGVDVTQRVRADDELRSAKKRLQQESEALSQKNIALSHILEHIEKDRENFRDELSGTIENLLMPFLKKLRAGDGCLSDRDIEHLEDVLKSILGKEVDVFQRNLTHLSGRELQVAEMIRNGLSSKEIATRLDVSPETVHKHRESIRRKLQMTRSSVNLTAFLKSRPWPL